MRFIELFQDPQHDPVISFEIYPPKTDKGAKTLQRVIDKLLGLQPSYMTVTYGAMGSTQDKTFGIAAGLKRDHGIETASHFTCVGASRSDIDAYLDQLHESGIENIIALRGDPPRGEDEFTPAPDGYAHANQLVEHISARDQFGIVVAGYPEKHLEAPSMEEDLVNLKRKVDAGADYIITQLFFNNDNYFSFVEQAREMGITCPIVPGLLPIQSAKQIRRIAEMCGAIIPPDLDAALSEAGADNRAAGQVGIDWCIDQVRELIGAGVPGIHFYVLNRSSHIVPIMHEVNGAIATRDQANPLRAG